MTQPDDELISTQAASQLWQRAARLQAESMRHLEEQAQQRLRDEAQAQGSEELSVGQVKAIAAESGIAPEFIQMALAQTTLNPEPSPLSPSLNALATQLLGSAEPTLRVSSMIQAPLSEVYTMMQQVFPAAPYGLTLYDVLGEVSSEQAGLIFDVPPMGNYSYESLSYYMAYIDVKQLYVHLRATGTGACEIVITGQLDRGRWNNLLGSVAVTTIGAGLGGGVGAIIGVKALALAGAMAALPTGLGLALMGVGAAWAYRAAYQWGLNKSRDTLKRLLNVLSVQIRTKGAFPLPMGGGQVGESESTLFLG